MPDLCCCRRACSSCGEQGLIYKNIFIIYKINCTNFSIFYLWFLINQVYKILFNLITFNVAYTFSSVQFSCSVVSDSLWPHELQHPRPPSPSPTHGVHSNSPPSVGDVIQPSHPLSSPSAPAPKPSKHQSLFQWVNSSHEVAKVLEFQL